MSIPTTPQSRLARSRLAKCARVNGPEADETTAARRDFAAARLDDYIRDTLAKTTLTDEQLERLAGLLRAAQ